MKCKPTTFEWFASSASASKQRKRHSHEVAQKFDIQSTDGPFHFWFNSTEDGEAGAKTANRERRKCKGKKNAKKWKKCSYKIVPFKMVHKFSNATTYKGKNPIQKKNAKKTDKKKQAANKSKKQNRKKNFVCLVGPRGGCRILRLSFMQRWKLVCLHTLVMRSIHGVAYFSQRKRLAFDLQGCWSFHACFTSVNVHFQLFAHLDVGCFLLATPTNLEEKSKWRV